MACGRLLDLVQPKVDPVDPPTPKTLHWNQTWVDRTTRCCDMAIINFLRWRPAAILAFIKSKIAPFHLLTHKPT